MTTLTATTSRTRPTTLLPVLVVAAPVLELISELVAPREPGGLDDAGTVAFLRDNAGRLTASWLIGLLAAAAIGTAYVVIACRLTGRGRIVGRVAAVLGVLGAGGLAAHMGISLGALDLALSDPGLGGAIDTLDGGRAALATIPTVVLGLNLAIVLVSVAGARAGWIPRWGILLGVAALVGDFSPTSYNTVIHACFAAALFALMVRGWDRSLP
jgi:hypothetical protein